MMSRWPLVTGSNDPGQTARRTRRLPRSSRAASVGGRHRRRDRTKAWPRRSGGRGQRPRPRPASASSPPRVARSTTTSASSASQPPVEQVGEHRAQVVVGAGRTAGRGRRRRTAPRARAGRPAARRRSRATVGAGQARAPRRCARSACARRRPVALDQQDVRGTAATAPRGRPRRSRRTGRGPGAPASDRSSDLERGEQRLAGPVGGRPGDRARRHGEPAARRPTPATIRVIGSRLVEVVGLLVVDEAARTTAVAQRRVLASQVRVGVDHGRAASSRRACAIDAPRRRGRSSSRS